MFPGGTAELAVPRAQRGSARAWPPVRAHSSEGRALRDMQGAQIMETTRKINNNWDILIFNTVLNSKLASYL